jgi:putative aldouronate transport system permease protein
MKQTTISQRVFDTINILLMLCLTVITLYPFWHVICGSFSDGYAMMAHAGALLAPKGLDLTSYKAVFGNMRIISGYTNTIIVVLGGAFLNVVMTSIGAYCLSRKNVYWNGIIMKLITFTMFFGGGLIPTYLLVSRTLRMDDSLLALIIPGAISTYNLIIMRTAFSQVPESLVESAELDGASHPQILMSVVFPLSLAATAVITLYYAVAHWNSWFPAAIYLRSRSKHPLQLVLREILIQNSLSTMPQNAAMEDQYFIGETIKYAVIVVATAPILCVYPYLQRYFMKGVMIGAIKG